MFSLQKPSIYQAPKCFVTYGTMGYPDTDQLPSKTKPWSVLLSQDYIHNIDLIIPEDALQPVKDKILNDIARIPSYYRVIMSLGQVLEGEFFTWYIKVGNIMMLSEGKVGTNNVFSIKDGKLTMYLDKESYERAGLVGKPHGVKGARGLKPRWVVEYDLRSPSALHGKKGFDRLVYACKNVLNKPATWLFCNLSDTPSPDPMAQHNPIKYTSSPVMFENMAVNIPLLGVPSAVLTEQSRQELDDYCTDIYEWLSLVRLESPRIQFDDKIDPYLANYVIPGDSREASDGRLCKISWRGFIPPRWAASTLAELFKATPAKGWFSFSVTPFTRVSMGHGAEFTIMRPPGSRGEYMLWDIKAHE